MQPSGRVSKGRPAGFLKKDSEVKQIISAAVLVLQIMAAPGVCGELENWFDAIAALNIRRQAYTLCATLSLAQQDHARKHKAVSGSKQVYRFQDKTLNIVADQATHRVLVMFEQFDKIDSLGVQTLVGDLFMAYGEPTVFAHDQVVYWAWDKEKKITSDQYHAAKEHNKGLDIIASVKLNSDIKITEKPGKKQIGNAYYIISSAPVLQFFKEE